MCVISFYRPGVMPRMTCLQNGADVNPHGHGYAVIAGSDIIVGKSMDADAAIEAFIRIRTEHPDSYALFHSRITTDGATNEENCHPFIVGGDPRTVLAHNGILPKDARPGKGDPRSDTRILAEDMIPRGDFGHLTNRRARRRLSRWALRDRYPNKLVILTTDPRYGRNAYLINEHLGEWSDGVWWSNDSYKPSLYTSYYGSGYRWGGKSTGTQSFFYSETRADWDTGDWDALYSYGIIGQQEWTSGVTGCYAAMGTWIKKHDDPGPNRMLRQALWSARMEALAESTGGTGPVGAETVPTGWPETRTHGKCSLCGDPEGQNLATGYCRSCDSCTDCQAKTADCLCYVPGTSQRWANVSDDDGDDGPQGPDSAPPAARPVESETLPGQLMSPQFREAN